MWCQQRPQAALVLHSLCFSPHPHPSDLSGLSCLVCPVGEGNGTWGSGCRTRPQGSPAVLPSSLPLPLPSKEDGCSPHCTLTRVSACWMCYSRVCQDRPCLLGSLYCLLHLRGFRKGEPYVPVALLAVGNREPLHSHCVPVSWKDQSLCVCVGDTACLVTLRLERCCAWPSASGHLQLRPWGGPEEVAGAVSGRLSPPPSSCAVSSSVLTPRP